MSVWELFISKIYSLFWGFRYLSIHQALHVPVLIHPSVKVRNLTRGSILFTEPLRHSMLILGFEGTLGQSNCKSMISIKNGGKLLVGNNVRMARGTRLVINGGTMKVGTRFWCNGDCYFYCTTKITIGDDNMYGWSISFNTTDGHHVYENGVQKPMNGDITIGNHVWIASHCILSKNTFVANDCVVAQNSLLSKKYETNDCLIGGIPAKILKSNYTWTGK